MMYILIRVDAPMGTAIGAKESIAQDLEKYGDTRVLEVREEAPEQMRMGGAKWS